MKHTHIIYSKRIAIALLTAICGATSAQGQGLVKEVTGIRDFAPEKRPATRIETAPEFITPQLSTGKPTYTHSSITVDVPPVLSVMALAQGEAIYPRSDKRGYAALGYGPKADIDISAGYRIIGRENLTLNAWGQMCRNYFHGRLYDEAPNMRLTTTDLAFGASLAYKPSKAGVLTVSTSYSYDMFNYPGNLLVPSSQRVGIYRLNADWTGRVGSNFTYGATGKLFYAGYSKISLPADYTPHEGGLHETGGGISAWLDFKCSEKVNFMLDIAYDITSRNKLKNLSLSPDEDYDFEQTKGVLSITPKVGFTGQKMSGYLGFNFAHSTGSAHGNNIGADVAWNWMLSPYFSFNLAATSGATVNGFDRLYTLDRYAIPPFGIGVSYVPLDATASFNLLSIKGFYMQLGAGFAAAKDWMCPALVTDAPTFACTDLHSLRFFAKAGYRYGETLDVEVSVESANNNNDDESFIDADNGRKYYTYTNRAYYRWADRAKQVVTAHVNWHPIRSVTLSAGYEFRNNRTIACLNHHDDLVLASLGNINALTVGAHWQITDLVGVFGRVEGICQGRYLQANGMPGQRLRPLAGVTLKF